MVSLKRASELASRLSRTRNYPSEEAGVSGLARGLQEASNDSGIAADRIVDKCRKDSEFCPTDHDILAVARELAAQDLARKTQQAQDAARVNWPKEYGPAKPFAWNEIDQDKVKRVRDRERTMYREIKAKYPGELSWSGMAAAARELGYDDYATAWENAQC